MGLGLLYGGIAEIILTLAMSGLIALAVDTGLMEQEKIGYAVIILLVVTSLIGAMITYKQVKRQRMLVCLLSGVVYLAMLLSIAALFFGGIYSGMSVTAVMIGIGTMGAAFLGAGGEGRGKRRKMKVLTAGHR